MLNTAPPPPRAGHRREKARWALPHQGHGLCSTSTWVQSHPLQSRPGQTPTNVIQSGQLQLVGPCCPGTSDNRVQSSPQAQTGWCWEHTQGRGDAFPIQRADVGPVPDPTPCPAHKPRPPSALYSRTPWLVAAGRSRNGPSRRTLHRLPDASGMCQNLQGHPHSSGARARPLTPHRTLGLPAPRGTSLCDLAVSGPAPYLDVLAGPSRTGGGGGPGGIRKGTGDWPCRRFGCLGPPAWFSASIHPSIQCLGFLPAGGDPEHSKERKGGRTGRERRGKKGMRKKREGKKTTLVAAAGSLLRRFT